MVWSQRSKWMTVLALAAVFTGTARGADAWKPITTEQGLPGNEVQFIKRDPSAGNGVWVGVVGGLAKFADGKIEKTAIGGSVWDVHGATPAKYWVGTAGGALLVEGDKTTVTLKGSSVGAIVPLGDKEVLALAKNPRTETNTLMRLNGADWDPVTPLKGKNVLDIVRLGDGKVWARVEGDGVRIFDPAKGAESVEVAHQGQNVTAVIQDSAGRVWCGLWQKSLAVWDGKAWSDHLKSKTFYALAIREDAKKNIWVATDQAGLWRFDGKEWVNDLKAEGGVTLLEPTSDGRVWVSTQKSAGLKVWDGAKWSVSMDGPTPLRCLVELPDKTLLVGGVLDGLFVLRK